MKINVYFGRVKGMKILADGITPQKYQQTKKKLFAYKQYTPALCFALLHCFGLEVKYIEHHFLLLLFIYNSNFHGKKKKNFVCKRREKKEDYFCDELLVIFLLSKFAQLFSKIYSLTRLTSKAMPKIIKKTILTQFALKIVFGFQIRESVKYRI